MKKLKTNEQETVYFYMLDRDEQIQVLKQYRERLFLLEEDELEEPIQELEKIKSKRKNN